MPGTWGIFSRKDEEREVQRRIAPVQGHAVGTWLSGDGAQGSDCPDQGFNPETWNFPGSQDSSPRSFCLLTQWWVGAWAKGQHNDWMVPPPAQAQAPGHFPVLYELRRPGARGLPPHPLSQVSDKDPGVQKDLLTTISNILPPNNYNSSWAI